MWTLNLQFYSLKNKTYGDCFLKRFTRPLNKLKNPTSTRKQLGIKKYKEKNKKNPN
jgi:hypothetical protein